MSVAGPTSPRFKKKEGGLLKSPRSEQHLAPQWTGAREAGWSEGHPPRLQSLQSPLGRQAYWQGGMAEATPGHGGTQPKSLRGIIIETRVPLSVRFFLFCVYKG